MANPRRTTEQYKENVYKKHKGKVEILSEYNGDVKPIDFLYHCEKHGDTYKTMNAKNIFGKSFQPCKQCDLELKSMKAKSAVKDKSYQYNRLKQYCEDKGGKLLSNEWITAKSRYLIHCGNPDHPNFEAVADSLLNKPQWCPYCCGRKGDFNGRYKKIIEDNDGQMLSEYINAETHIKVKCNKDGYEWDIYPSNIDKGRWCPLCSLPYSEKVVYDYLKNNNYNIILQYSFDDLRGKTDEYLKYDFAILDKNNKLLGLLEVDDEEHRYTYKKCTRRIKARERDKIKDKYCLDHNIKLFRLYYYTKWAKSESYEWYYDYIHNNLSKFLTEIINISIA